mgnify:FL=1
MIVKNEEKVLPRILKPMKEIVDKILICDTGSTDRTKEIIREFTAEVYDFHGMIFLLPGILFWKKSVLITGCGWMQTT